LQPRLPGYRQIDDRQAVIMTEIKLLERTVGAALAMARHSLISLGLHNPRAARQLAMARSSFELGFYHTIRAIAQPDDPLDPTQPETAGI
jgi:hypothetical protein